MHYRNLLILTMCQLISATGSIVVVILGGIIGTSLAENPVFATFPVSMMVLCIAAAAIPAAMLMKRIGRKAGFALGSVSAVFAMLLAAWSLQQQSFWLFVVSAGLVGVNMAFTQQYRFAAAESVESSFAGRAISMVLLGAIGGALVGPELVVRGQFWIADAPYAGTLMVAASLYVVQLFLFLALGPLHIDEQMREDAYEQRPIREIVRQRVFMVAVLGGTVAYGVMSFVMTATPISMHVHDGFTINDTAGVIRSHVLGMYVPSLISGFLLDRFGTTKIMSVGALCLMAAIVIGVQDRSFMHYLSALVVLGVGWNFLYVGATTLLTRTYTNSERFKAQAVNEFSVFGMSALASLLAGTVIHVYGWTTLILLPIPVLLLIMLALYMVRHEARTMVCRSS